MGTKGVATKLILLSLLAVSFVAATNAAGQSLDVISKLRGFSEKMFEREQGYPFNSEARSVVSYRRLDAAATEADASNKANEVGASVRKAIKQLRGGTDKFYEDLVTAAKIYLCEQDVKKTKKGPSVRYVDCTAENAYKDDDGNEVKLAITPMTDADVVNNYGQGRCEINPDCYWDEILPGDTTRAKRYADVDSTMNAKAADDKIKEWITGVAGFVIPGIVLSVLSLLTMVFFMICRCGCNRCGGRFPREEGYTCMQKFLPVLFFLAFAIGVVGVSAAAFLYRGTMLSAVDDLFNATSGTLDNSSDWIVRIRTPMEQIAAQVTSSAGTVQVKLNGTGFIDTGIADITSKLRSIGTNANGLATIPAGCTSDVPKGSCLKCGTCSQIGKDASAAADQVDTTTGPGIKELSNVKEQLNTKLVDISNTVQNSVDTQVETADEFSDTLDGFKGDVKDFDKTFQGYRDMLGYAIMALFAIALVVIVIGLIGILFGLTPLKVLANIMHIAYFLGFIVLFLTFLISAIALAIGVVLGDACELTKIVAANWTVLPLGDPAKVVDACFQNESLLEVFNLSDKLSFARGGIEFPDLDMTSVLDFDDLDNFTTSMQSVDESAFGFDNNNRLSDTLDSGVTDFNSYATQSAGGCQLSDAYKVINVLTPWLDISPTATSTMTPANYIKDRYTSKDAVCETGKAFSCGPTACTFSEFMRQQYQVLANMATAEKFMTQLRTDAKDITTSKNSFSTKTTKFNDDINDIKADLNGNLIKYVGDFEEAMYCKVIADGFWIVYEALCGDLMPAITMIALMLFLCGVFLIPVNVCLIIGVKRLKAHGNGHIMDSEMKFK